MIGVGSFRFGLFLCLKNFDIGRSLFIDSGIFSGGRASLTVSSNASTGADSFTSARGVVWQPNRSALAISAIKGSHRRDLRVIMAGE